MANILADLNNDCPAVNVCIPNIRESGKDISEYNGINVLSEHAIKALWERGYIFTLAYAFRFQQSPLYPEETVFSAY